MSMIHDNPGQGNRGEQEYGEDNFHKSSGNQDNQRSGTHNEKEKKQEESEDDEFSPGEPDGYDSEDFATD